VRVQVIVKKEKFYYLVDRLARTKPRRDKELRSDDEAPSRPTNFEISTQANRRG